MMIVIGDFLHSNLYPPVTLQLELQVRDQAWTPRGAWSQDWATRKRIFTSNA